MPNQITYNPENENELTLAVIPAPLVIRVFFMILLIVAVAVPILSMVLIAQSGTGIKFGNLVVIGLSGLLVFYLLRMLLWNSYGVEKYLIYKDRLKYHADYRYFKDGRKEIELNTLSIGIQDIEEGRIGRLLFKDEEKSFASAVKVPIVELEELIAWFEERISNEMTTENH